MQPHRRERSATAPTPADQPPFAVQVSAVSHTYAARDGTLVPALRDLDLAVPRGQFLALLGPSGCGKSTLLRLVAGLLHPTSGTVRLEGVEPKQLRAARQIGWLAQDDGLFPWLRVEQNVGLAMRPTNAGRIQDALDRVGLGDVATRYPHELSGGMRQRAALARALAASPRLLLLDEPFAHLDEINRERLGDLLIELRSPETTTLFVTHSAAEAARLADRVLVFSSRPGRIVADVPVASPHPRQDDDPALGRVVRDLKEQLR